MSSRAVATRLAQMVDTHGEVVGADAGAEAAACSLEQLAPMFDHFDDDAIVAYLRERPAHLEAAIRNDARGFAETHGLPLKRMRVQRETDF